jgi:hypothetical protein
MGVTQSPAHLLDDAARAAEGGGGGSWLANVPSALAFLFSGLSFYTSALQQADLEVYVPPVLQYGRDGGGGGDVDVFAVPITIANGGANTGTVLAMELVVENLKAAAEPKSKTFYSAFIGEHLRLFRQAAARGFRRRGRRVRSRQDAARRRTRQDASLRQLSSAEFCRARTDPAHFQSAGRLSGTLHAPVP